MLTKARSLSATSIELVALYDQFQRRESDNRFCRDGGKVYYALDNDVTTTVTAPWLDEGSHVFGPLFTNISEAHFAFASIFSEYVFAKGSSQPFLLIPPANNELEGQWNAVLLQAADILTGIENHFSALLTESQDDVNKRELNGDSDLFQVIERAIQVIHGGKSPATELRRISRLAECGALRRLDAYLDDDGYPIGSIPEPGKDLSRAETNWLRRLQKVRPKGDSSNSIDASVMATLELMNIQFQRGAEARKICLITGDAHLLQAASEVMLDSGRSFSQEYLRRPTAFLVDKDFFHLTGVLSGPDESSESDAKVARTLAASVGDWIKEIAAIRPGEALGVDRQRSTNLVEAIEEARTSWSRFLRSAGALNSISQKEIHDIAHTHVMAARFLHKEDVRDRFDKLRQQAKLVGEESKLRFSVAGALSRFWSADSALAKAVDRLPPIIRFDSLTCAEQVASEISVRRGEKIRELQRSKDWLIRLQKEDDSRYTTMIIFALAFSTLGEWGTALNVAKTAYAIARARKSLKTESGIKGDEAAYLCAVFSRLVAKVSIELGIAVAWLDESKKLLHEAPVREDLKRGVVSDNRLEAEKLSIRLTRKLFLEFSPSGSDLQVAFAFTKEVETFQLLYEANRELLLSDIGRETVRGRYTYLQALVNALQCSLFSAPSIDFNTPENSKVRDAAIEEIVDIVDASRKGNEPSSNRGMRSAFCNFILMVSGVVLFSDRLSTYDKRAIKEQLKAAPISNNVFPYDYARKLALLELANR